MPFILHLGRNGTGLEKGRPPTSASVIPVFGRNPIFLEQKSRFLGEVPVFEKKNRDLFTPKPPELHGWQLATPTAREKPGFWKKKGIFCCLKTGIFIYPKTGSFG